MTNLLIGLVIGMVIGWQADKAYVRSMYRWIKKMKRRVKGR